MVWERQGRAWAGQGSWVCEGSVGGGKAVRCRERDAGSADASACKQYRFAEPWYSLAGPTYPSIHLYAVHKYIQTRLTSTCTATPSKRRLASSTTRLPLPPCCPPPPATRSGGSPATG